MKKIIVLFLLSLSFCGCSSFPFDVQKNSHWSGDIGNAKGSVAIVSVSAERPGDWGALEEEARDLLPLLFSEKSYRVVSDLEGADYAADVKLREREYADGWRTKRSLSVEVRVWKRGALEPLPLSAGRSTIQGKQSLAASRTLNKMLRKAVRNAIRGLPGVK